jgi:hypothetical protein
MVNIQERVFGEGSPRALARLSLGELDRPPFRSGPSSSGFRFG